MKPIPTRLLLAVGALVLALVPTARAQLVITEVMSSAGGTGATGIGNVDWFELTNLGGSAADITGYKMDDNSAAFGSAVALVGVTSIGAGQSVVFIESAAPGTDIPAFRTLWGGISGITIGSYTGSGVGLSATSDAVNLFDSGGTLVTGVTFGAATAGTSFDNHGGATGAISTLSVAGSFGAFTAANATAVTGLFDVGSPGAIADAIPEPSTYAAILGALALAGTAWSRRRAAPAQ